MKRKLLIATILTVIGFGNVKADEGMWLPALVHKLNIGTLQQMGLQISAEDIYNINHSSLKDAIVALDNGSCTAELVSAEGLLFTNHHCGFDEIQAHSSVEHDYLTNGFWAKSKEEELPNPGKTAKFLVRFEDVTDKITPEIKDGMTENERSDKIREISAKIRNEATADTHYEAQVQQLFNGNRFYLFVYETFRDIRLVGAPPSSIGKFGGDTDNWMWPRHNCDFSMFRIYCGKDGKPADYSPDNIPYTPKHFLPISLKGVEKGDFAMILGYPGGTNRYMTSFGVETTMKIVNDVRIKVREAKLKIIKDYMETSKKAMIQYASKHARSSNYYKFSIGQNKGLAALNIIEKKKEIENSLTEWINQSDERKAKYGQGLELIKQAYADTDTRIANQYYTEAVLAGPEIMLFAANAKSLYDALEREKNKEHIISNTERIKQRVEDFYKDYDVLTDQKIAATLIKIYRDNVKERFHPDFFKEVDSKYKGNFDAFMEELYKKSVFTDQKRLTEFLCNPKFKVLDKDKLFKVSVELIESYSKFGDQMSEYNQKLTIGNRLFLAGLLEMYKTRNFYPDASSTMRLTYGTVGDYKPRDGVQYSHFTTLLGYIEKEIPGDFEFDVPAKLKEMYYDKDFGRYADKDGTLHTCFLTNNDITGGNSGSPVINSKGELIGLAFDGNWEAMSGDIAFEPELQKCINADIRFVIWVIDKFAGATNLVNEMKFVE